MPTTALRKLTCKRHPTTLKHERPKVGDADLHPSDIKVLRDRLNECDQGYARSQILPLHRQSSTDDRGSHNHRGLPNTCV